MKYLKGAVDFTVKNLKLVFGSWYFKVPAAIITVWCSLAAAHLIGGPAVALPTAFCWVGVIVVYALKKTGEID